MKRMMLLVSLGLFVGCQQNYYRVTDVQSGKEFYTKAWLPGLYGRCGQIHFTELSKGDHVVLQSSRVTEVTEADALNPGEHP